MLKVVIHLEKTISNPKINLNFLLEKDLNLLTLPFLKCRKKQPQI